MSAITTVITATANPVKVLDFKFLKAELKEYKALGHPVNVKLNKKHTQEYLNELTDEYIRLEAEINGEICCDLASDVLEGDYLEEGGWCGRSEDVLNGWVGKSSGIDPQPVVEASSPESEDVKPGVMVSEAIGAAPIHKFTLGSNVKSRKQKSVPHSFQELLQQAKKSQSYGFGGYLQMNRYKTA